MADADHGIYALIPTVQPNGRGKKLCLICDRDAKDKEFCKLYEKAHQNLRQVYEQWTKALRISWKDYLEAVAKNPNTGRWVKEVAEHLLKEGVCR